MSQRSQSNNTARSMMRALTLALMMAAGPGIALAQVTVNQILFPSNIGRTLDATVTIDYTRTSGAAVVIQTPIAPQLSVNPPAPPAGCRLIAGPAIECDVPAGGSGDTGSLTFQVRGATLGAFSLVATGTGGSNASNTGSVRSSGELTVLKSKLPAGNLLNGQTATFTLQPQLAAGADDLPASSTLTVTDQLPGTLTDFTVSAIAPGIASCNAVGAANTSRTVTCVFTGPLTAAQVNAASIVITGAPGNSGSFTNVGSVAADQATYFDRNTNNNTANVSYTVDPASDVQALGSFISTPVPTGSVQNLTLTFQNNGPSNLPAGGTVSTTIPAGFTVNSLPAGCVGPATGVVLGVNTVLTCTAAGVLNGSSQSFVVPLTMPAAPTSGNFVITVAPPSGFGDAVPGNNSVTLPYTVAAPFADLRGAKSKLPASGPIAAGSTITTTLTVTNDAASTTAATYSATGAGTPLRVVDYLRPQEIAGDVIGSVSAGWSCVVSNNADPTDAARTKRVLCERTLGGTLAVGASLSVSFSTTVGVVVGQVTLSNRMCTGETVLSELGLTGVDGPQPAGSGQTGNDCASAGADLIGTSVGPGSAAVTVVKESSIDGITWVDNPALAPTLLATAPTQFWRITLTTPVGGIQATIPTLNLTDTIPSILNVTSGGAPAPNYLTPAITVNTNVTAGSATVDSCPSLAAGNNALSCRLTSVTPGTTVVVTYSVQRPFSGGTVTNTANLSSPNAILTGTLSDAAALVIQQRIDVATTTKIVTPATPRVGQNVQFTVTAQNLGPDDVAAVGDFKVIDDFNTSIAGVSVAFGDIVANGNTMSCTVANAAIAGEAALAVNHVRVRCTNTTAVPRYSTRTITIGARVLKPATLPASGNAYTNQNNTARTDIPDSLCEFKTETSTNASVSSACNDAASTSNNTRSVTFNVAVPLIDLQQRKTRVLPAGQSSFGVGQPLRYRFRIQNNGPSRAEGVQMTDRLTVPAGFTLSAATVFNVNGSAAESGYTLDTSKTGTVSCSQGGANADVVCLLSVVATNNFLDSGAEVNFEIELAQTGVSIGPVSFRNEALVCADETAAYESSGACDRAAANNNNLAAVNDTVFPRTDLSLTKTTVTALPVGINQPVQFRLLARNLGPNATQQIRIIDTLPANFEFIGSGVNAPSVALGSFVTQAPSTVTGSGLSCSASPAAITAPGQVQTVTCAINANPGPLGVGAFPGSADVNNTITLTLYARAKDGFFTGPYLSNVTNGASVAPGLDGSGNPLSIDTVAGNNGGSSVAQVTRSSLAGRVFNDRNGNGVQDGTGPAQDEGIGNVTLVLSGTDAYGNTVTRTQTSVNAVGATRGDYFFGDLPAGTYTVTETQPAGFVNSVGTPAAPSAGGSYTAAATATTSTYTAINLGVGVAATAYLFPESLAPASISGSVFIDRDGNGLFGAGDVPVVGVSIGLYPAGTVCPASGPLPGGALQTVVTDGAGNYTITAVTSGNSYVLCEFQPLGLGDSPPRPGGSATTPRANQIDITNLPITGSQVNNFPELLARISGTVFYDFNAASPGTNNNGVQNAGEPGIGSGTAGAGVPMTLTGTPSIGPGAGVPITPVTVTTGADGSYSFGDLYPGNYSVSEGLVPVALGNYQDGINTAGTVTAGSAGTAGAVGDNNIRNIVLSGGGAQSPGNNFAELPRVAISGLVYLDRNRDGTLTGADPSRLLGVTIELRQGGSSCANATLVGSTTTAADGSYVFPGGTVTAGQVLSGQSYRICELQPAGYGDGTTNPGAGAASPVANEIVIAALPLNGSASNNFGENAARIAGTVFLDRDNNGAFAGADSAISAVSITLSGPALPTPLVAITLGDGSFAFEDLPSGVFTLTEQAAQPVVNELGINVTTLNGRTTAGTLGGTASSVVTTPSTISPINLPAGGSSLNNLFGEILPAAINGRVWLDTNNDGLIDAGEGGIRNVQITLSGTDDLGRAVNLTTTTAADGSWSFVGLRPGTYAVTEPTQPNDTLNGKVVPGSAGGNGTAEGTLPSAISAIVLGAGAVSSNNNFGELPAPVPTVASIAGRVWLDSDNNGQVGSAERGISGITIELSGNAGGVTVARTTTTDALGNYRFDNLPPGNYTVREPVQPAGTNNGVTLPGTRGGTGTPVGTTPSVISGIVVAAGQSAVENNFFEIPLASSLSGRVWNDTNDNGLIDSGEAGIAGVSIVLTGVDENGQAVNRSTPTGADGSYLFDNLRPGTYTVTEPTQPGGTNNGKTVPGSTGGNATSSSTVPSVINAIVLGLGVASVNNNFGEIPPAANASISGRVWIDSNNNGLIDGAEVGIPGVTIELTGTDAAGNAITRSTTTDAQGRWRFDNLPAGTYAVREPTQPAGTLNGQTVPGSRGGNATGVAAVPSVISNIVLGSGQSSVDNNFGEVQPASLSGRVWNDTNDNGVIDGAETGIAGVLITLTGTDDSGQAINRSTTTGSDGSYRFDNLRPGNYTVTEPSQPPGTANGKTVPGSTGGTATAQSTVPSVISAIALAAGTNSINNNFGETPPGASISGRVWLDSNNNGRIDGAEVGIAGVSIELTGTDINGNTITRSTTTDALGNWRFDNLPPGTYTVREPTQPAGTLNGQTVPGSTGGTATPVGTLPSAISTIVLAAGQDSVNNNFGEVPPAALSGRVWIDSNDNGVIDGAELGIPGVTVTLSGLDSSGAAVTRSTTTDADGRYRFDNLLPGTYGVQEPTQPAATLNGKTVPGPVGGVATPVATTPSAISGIVLAAGQQAPENNFGELLKSSLSGRVWTDTNDNGVIDAGETGIADVTVTLTGRTDAGDVVASVSVVTGPDGSYLFDNLRPGTYVVTEPTQPAGTGNGKTVPGSTGGTATPQNSAPSVITSITLPAGVNSVNNNFGEIPAAVDLVVSKTAKSAKFTVGRTVGYSIQVRNLGSAASSGSYTVSDRLPVGLTLAAAPTGAGWSCNGAANASSFSCTSSTVLAAGASHPATIELSVLVGAAAAAASPALNAVLVEGGGEGPRAAPSPAERAAFEGNPVALPVCSTPASHNACITSTPVQLAAALSGTVWLELGPRARELDPSDRRLPNWRVEVIDPATGAVVASTVTGPDGRYRFTDLEPGVPYVVRFREPGTGIVYGWPVNGEAPGAGTACSTTQVPSSCTARGTTPVLTVVLAPGRELEQQSLPVDPSGVVYDAVTRDPIAGATVALAPAGVCAGWNPATQIAGASLGGYRITGNAISMVTDSSGYYQFLLLTAAPARCNFAVTVTPPAGYTAPSQLIPAQPGTLANPGVPGAVLAVQPQATAPTGPAGPATVYYLTLDVGSATPDVVHNHIPLDPGLPASVQLSKTADKAVAELGDSVRYTVTLRVGSGVAPRQVSVVDRLPAGFSYIPGTAVVNGQRVADPARGPGGSWVFQLGALPTGGNAVLQYRARVGVGAAEGDGINRVNAFACGAPATCLVPGTLTPIPQARPSNSAQFRVRVQGGVFGGEACVLGKVFVDCRGNHVQSAEQLGIPGVRLVMQDGTLLVTDSEGKYSMCGVPPKSHVIRVDPLTLPRGSRLTTSSNRNLGDAGSLWLDIKRGELHRGDFIEGSCSNTVVEQVKARRAQGEVRAPETEKASRPALRFDSKAHGQSTTSSPQQGTDGANQQAPKPRAAGDKPAPGAANDESNVPTPALPMNRPPPSGRRSGDAPDAAASNDTQGGRP